MSADLLFNEFGISHPLKHSKHDQELVEKMPTTKIGDIKPPCTSREHYAPDMMVWPPGEYEHVCPSCGFRYKFTVYPNMC